MRIFIGMVLALGFFAPGVVVLVAGAGMWSDGGWSDDVGAALFMGGMLALIGVLIFVAVRKAHKEKRPADPDAAIANIVAMTVITGDLADDGD